MANEIKIKGVQSPPGGDEFQRRLQQALESERRRWRGEFLRLALVFLVLLALVLGGGGFFVQRQISALRAEQRVTAQFLQALLERSSHEPFPAPFPSEQTEAPVLGPGAISTQEQAEIQQLLTELEAKRQPLAESLAERNTQTRELLDRRESELRALHQRLDEVQRKIMKASPPESAQPATDQAVGAQKINARERPAGTPPPAP